MFTSSRVDLLKELSHRSYGILTGKKHRFWVNSRTLFESSDQRLLARSLTWRGCERNGSCANFITDQSSHVRHSSTIAYTTLRHRPLSHLHTADQSLASLVMFNDVRNWTGSHQDQWGWFTKREKDWAERQAPGPLVSIVSFIQTLKSYANTWTLDLDAAETKLSVCEIWACEYLWNDFFIFIKLNI